MIFLKRIYHFLKTIGIDPLLFIKSIRGIPAFTKNYILYSIQKKNIKNSNYKNFLQPCLSDRFAAGGTAIGHYFHQDLFIANKIFINNPRKHVDIGSRVDGFVAHVASFREIEVLDIRKHTTFVNNINFIQGDFLNIGSSFYNYCDSISSLHAIEHFGLGRYGDPVKLDGHLIAIENIYKMLQNEGKFYFSIPIGLQRIEFDAHRVFSLEYLLRIIEPKFNVVSFSYVDDLGELHPDVVLTSEGIQYNFNCYYGCGILELKK